MDYICQIINDNIESIKTLLIASFGAVVTMILSIIKEEFYSKPAKLRADRSKLSQALLSEINTIMNIYNHMSIEENMSNPKLPTQIPFGDDIVSVYMQNAKELGVFQEDELGSIIEFYIRLRAIINARAIMAKRWDDYALYKRTYKDGESRKEELYNKEIDCKNILSYTIQRQRELQKAADKAINVLSKEIFGNDKSIISFEFKIFRFKFYFNIKYQNK